MKIFTFDPLCTTSLNPDPLDLSLQEVSPPRFPTLSIPCPPSKTRNCPHSQNRTPPLRLGEKPSPSSVRTQIKVWVSR